MADSSKPGTLAPFRLRLAVAAVLDVALHARPQPVAARTLAFRHGLPPRHLEPVLQALVRHNLLKGVRGPRGGYELARERRRITVGDIARAALSVGEASEAEPDVVAVDAARSVIDPVILSADAAFLAALDAVTIEDLCRRADKAAARRQEAQPPQFDI